jgi:hypothetical protein
MSKQSSYIVIGIIVIVVAVLVMGGGSWLWRELLAMHGVH